MFPKSMQIRGYDDELWRAIGDEERRQEEHIELIASENFASRAVLEARARCSPTSMPRAIPGKRYYGGCEYVDEVETPGHRAGQGALRRRARQRPAALRLPGQHGGLLAVLEPGDTVLGMSLAHGGHLTHGQPVNFSGKIYKLPAYGVTRRPSASTTTQVRATGRGAQPEDDRRRGQRLSARSSTSRASAGSPTRSAPILMVDMAHIAGLVAAGLIPNPVPYADFVTTTTHKTLRGPRGGMILCREEHRRRARRAVFPGIQGGPLMHIIAAKAVAFKEAMSAFRDYQAQVITNARAMAEVFVARGYEVVSGGTDNHLFLVDLMPRASPARRRTPGWARPTSR